MMVLPALVLFFVFHTIPVIQGVYYSFTDSPGYGPYELRRASATTSRCSPTHG